MKSIRKMARAATAVVLAQRPSSSENLTKPARTRKLMPGLSGLQRKAAGGGTRPPSRSVSVPTHAAQRQMAPMLPQQRFFPASLPPATWRPTQPLQPIGLQPFMRPAPILALQGNEPASHIDFNAPTDGQIGEAILIHRDPNGRPCTRLHIALDGASLQDFARSLPPNASFNARNYLGFLSAHQKPVHALTTDLGAPHIPVQHERLAGIDTRQFAYDPQLDHLFEALEPRFRPPRPTQPVKGNTEVNPVAGAVAVSLGTGFFKALLSLFSG